MLERKPPLTQQGLAERVGVTTSAVTGWLHGTIPYPKTLNRICLTLGVRRDWLMYGEGEKYLPAITMDRIEEMPATYTAREKITFIEEKSPELMPLVHSFLDSVRKLLVDERADKPEQRTGQSSRSPGATGRPKRAVR